MSTEEVLNRLRRLYFAVGAMKEFDVGQFPPKVTSTGLFQNFVGDLDSAQIENLAQMAISLIAHFDNHLTRWAKATGKNTEVIDDVMAKSEPLKLVIDLANVEKHAGFPRDGGRSGKSPRLIEVNRVLRMQTGSAKGSKVALTLHSTGPRVRGAGGGAAVIVDGLIVDPDNAVIADFHTTISKAVKDLEAMVARLGA